MEGRREGERNAHTHKHETHTEHERKHIHERDEMNTIDIVTVGTHVHGQRLY